MNGVVTIWDVEARMVAAVGWNDPRAAANEALTLMQSLRTTPFVRPGMSMDAILDAFNLIMARDAGT